jgi:hypothetical protein
MDDDVPSVGLRLDALDGANPLAFLAALGLLQVGDRMVGPGRWKLWWTDGVLSVPVLGGVVGIDEVVDAVLADRDAWHSAPALGWERITDVKLEPARCRSYLRACAEADDGGRSLGLAAALVAEGGVDNSGMAKPTDLHFTAGQQKFIRMAGQLRDGLTADHLHEALVGRWLYASTLPSLKWDVSDDRVYALSATNPATDTKLTVPGAEWLALLGLAAFPVFATAAGRTVTTSCEGPWKRGGTFRWPLWRQPLTSQECQLLVAHAHESRARAMGGWGVVRLHRCSIGRSDQGGYGSFSSPTVVWESA